MVHGSCYWFMPKLSSVLFALKNHFSFLHFWVNKWIEHRIDSIWKIERNVRTAKRRKYIFQIILCTADTHFIAGKQETLIHCISTYLLNACYFFYAFLLHFVFLFVNRMCVSLPSTPYQNYTLGLLGFSAVRYGSLFTYISIFVYTKTIFIDDNLFRSLVFESVSVSGCRNFVVEWQQ